MYSSYFVYDLHLLLLYSRKFYCWYLILCHSYETGLNCSYAIFYIVIFDRLQSWTVWLMRNTFISIKKISIRKKLDQNKVMLEQSPKNDCKRDKTRQHHHCWNVNVKEFCVIKTSFPFNANMLTFLLNRARLRIS